MAHLQVNVLPVSKGCLVMSRIMTKPVHVICEQRRHISSWTSVKCHPHSLISTFVVHSLDRIINTYSFYIWNSKTLAGFCSCSSLNPIWKYTPEDISHDMTKPTKWMCTQWRLRSAWASVQSDQSLRCPHEETSGPLLPIECTAKTLIRLGRCPGWSESSLGAHSFCWFCHVVAHFILWAS